MLLGLGSSSNELYQTKIEINNFMTGNEQFELVYVRLKNYPLYQLKYFEMLGYYVPPELKSPEYFLDINKFEKASSIKFHKNLPNFHELTFEESKKVKELYANEKQLLNYNFVQGKNFEKDENFSKALAAYEEGLKFKEQMSMLEMFKILVEPKEAQKFLIQTDSKRAVSILIENFIENGLFDNVSKSRETIYGVYLFYIYLDCFDEFRDVVFKEAKENSLLEFLLLPSFDDPKIEIPQIMKNIEFSYIQKKDLLLGDLYHSYFLGISNELEFNIRQYHYQTAIKQGNWNACARTGWINQVYLEIFLKKLDNIEGKISLEPEKNNDLEQQKLTIVDFINKTKKNYISSFSILKKKPQFKYSEEFLRFLLENNENLLPKDKNDKNNSLYFLRLLRSLGREDSLSDLFILLKMKFKIEGKSDELTDEMKKIALKLKGKINSEIAYCMEKNLGFDKNTPKIFQFYHDDIFIFFEDYSKLIYSLYRVGKLLEKTGNLKEYSHIFFEICLLKIINSLKNELSYENLYYLAKIYRRKTFYNDQKYALLILNYIQEKLIAKLHLDFSQKLLLLQINQKIKIQQNADQNKIALIKIMEKETKVFEEKIKKTPAYDYFIKDDLASYINQTFRSIVIKLDEHTQIERTLSPNLRYKNLSTEPEFSPFVMRRFKKLEQITHVFNENDLDFINFPTENEHFLNQLFVGIIKKNNQRIFMKEFKFQMDDIDDMIDFLNRLEFYLKLNSKYILSLIGFVYSKVSNKNLIVYVCFESFSELFVSYLKTNVTKYDPNIEFNKILINLAHLDKCDIHSIGFSLDNFCIAHDKQTLQFADFELKLLYKNPKMFLDITNQERIINLLEIYSAPELIKAFNSKSEIINMNSSSIWSLGCIFLSIFCKLKSLVSKDSFLALEKYSFEKIESQLKELFSTEPSIKPHLDILKKLFTAERTIELKTLLAHFKLESKLFEIDEEKLRLVFFKNVQFSEMPVLKDSDDSLIKNENLYKGLIYLPRKGIYEGEIKDDLPHGKGNFNMKSLSYDGTFEKGKLEGQSDYRSNEWEILFKGKFTDNIAQHGMITINSKNKENKAVDHSTDYNYIEFEKEYYLPTFENVNKMMKGFAENLGILPYNPERFSEKIKEYKNFFDTFLKNKEKYQKQIDSRANVLYYKDEYLKEFVVKKFEMIENFIILYNEKISKQEFFYFDQISFGLFTFENTLKSSLNFSSFFFESPLNGSLISYFGKKISGSFLDFKPLYGYKFNNFLNYSSFNNIKLIYQGTLKLMGEHKRDFNGSIINEKATGYGEETFNENYIYKGYYKENEPYGKGVLQEKTGSAKALIKGYFKRGLPLWGTYHKDKDVKYKGNFNFTKEGMTIFSFKSIKDLIDSIIIKGFLIKNDEKIFAQYGTFQHLDEEMISGFSKIEYKNGMIFEGNLEKSFRKGKGTLTIKKNPNELILAFGDWDNAKLRGTIKWEKSNEYDKSCGFFTFNDQNNPTMDGYGLILFKNGSQYYGGFKDNKLQGYGELDLKSADKSGKNKQYFGEFEEGKKSGFGVLKENEIEILTYKGSFKNNKKNGYAVVYKKDEKYLEGLFEDGMFKSGWIYVNDKTIEKIESNSFEYNEQKEIYIPKGFGTIYLKDGNKIECMLNNVIEEIAEKKIKRHGILISESGSFYEGVIVIVNDVFKIQTIGTFRNGTKMLYEGEFKYGQFQGYGKLFDKKGRVYQGMFEKGMKVGFGREIDENEENVFRGFWKNGVKEGYGKVLRAIDDKKDEFYVICQGLKVKKIVKI